MNGCSESLLEKKFSVQVNYRNEPIILEQLQYQVITRIINVASQNNGLDPTRKKVFEGLYSEAMTSYVQQMLDNPDRTIKTPLLGELAQNLANYSKSYIFETGDVLEWNF